MTTIEPETSTGWYRLNRGYYRLWNAIFGNRNSPPCSEAFPHRLAEQFEVVLATLPERAAVAITARFGLDGFAPKTLKETGVVLGVSTTRAKQICQRALRELRQPYRARSLRSVDNLDSVMEMRYEIKNLAKDIRQLRDNLHRDNLHAAQGTAAFQDPTLVEALQLTSRTEHCLRRAGISDMGQLLSTAPSDLLAIRQFGYGSLAEVMQKLALYSHPNDPHANIRTDPGVFSGSRALNGVGR